MFKRLLSVVLLSISLCSFTNISYATHHVHSYSPHALAWRLNTSNKNKLNDFQKIFNSHGVKLIATQIDLDEIDSDPISVVAHKASQLGEFTLIEDTSLDVEGADVGINVRWMIDHLQNYIGHTAHWRVLLAYRLGNSIIIYKGEIEGEIVDPQGESVYGFDAIFLPNGSKTTLAEGIEDKFNARAIAVKAMMNGKIFAVRPAIYDWDGPWQSH